MTVFDLDQARRRRNDGFLAWCYDPFKRRTPTPRSAFRRSPSGCASCLGFDRPIGSGVSHIRAAAYVIQSWPWPIGRLTRCSV